MQSSNKKGKHFETFLVFTISHDFLCGGSNGHLATSFHLPPGPSNELPSYPMAMMMRCDKAQGHQHTKGDMQSSLRMLGILFLTGTAGLPMWVSCP